MRARACGGDDERAAPLSLTSFIAVCAAAAVKTHTALHAGNEEL